MLSYYSEHADVNISTQSLCEIPPLITMLCFYMSLYKRDATFDYYVVFLYKSLYKKKNVHDIYQTAETAKSLLFLDRD